MRRSIPRVRALNPNAQVPVLGDDDVRTTQMRRQHPAPRNDTV
ncbi:hypothetical protein [Stenotrophomonas sp.]|nr:hypothetical protein [Stenotrophomonas sp.]